MSDDGVGACQLHTFMAFSVEFNTLEFFFYFVVLLSHLVIFLFTRHSILFQTTHKRSTNKRTNEKTCIRTLNGFNNKFDQIVKCVSIVCIKFTQLHLSFKVIGDVCVSVRACAFDFRLT